MKNLHFKRYVGVIILLWLLVMLFHLLLNGISLLGVPKDDDIERLEIYYPEMSTEIKEVTDKEEIKIAVHLLGTLRYSPFKHAESREGELITVTYFLHNGSKISVSANNETVWWHGKAHALKDENIFVKCIGGYFFLAEYVQKSGLA